MLWQIVGMAVIIGAIGLSIALHEIGHLVPAKRAGVRVSDYAIGFGPKLFGRRIGETLYAIRLIPLGGYIRMVGMYPPARGAARPGPFSKLAEEARAESMSEVLPSDAGRTFYELPVRKRLVIMLGGPTMNLLLSTVLFAVALIGIGLPSGSNIINSVAPCWFTAENPRGALDASGTCVDGRSAAAQAGLQKGDVIVAVNGKEVSDSTSLGKALASIPANGEATLTVRSASGATRTSEVTFQKVSRRDFYGDSSAAPTDTVSVVGVFTVPGRERLPITTVPQVMWRMTTGSAQAMAQFPTKIYELAQTLVDGGERDPNGPVSVVGVTRVGGEIAASEAQFADKVLNLLTLAASLNLFLFLFNLLPLLPLDGGHVAAALWEAVRDRARRLRGLVSAGPVDTARLLPLTYAMSILLIGVGSLVIFADIVKPISLLG